MPFLDRLKAMFGFSGVALDIRLPSDSIPRGAAVQGVVALRVGSSGARVRALSIQVIKRLWRPVNPNESAEMEELAAAEAAPESEAPLDQADPPPLEDGSQLEQEETVAASAVLAEDLILPGRAEETFAFSLELGDAAEPSSESVEWVLLAHADIPAAVDARAWKGFTIKSD